MHVSYTSHCLHTVLCFGIKTNQNWWLGRIAPYLVRLLTFQSSLDVILVIGRHPIIVWDRKYLGIGRVQRKAWILIFRVFVGVSELEVW
jgi:hypothetical protein